MLGVSAALALLMLVALAVGVNTAVLLMQGMRLGVSLGTAVRRIHWFVVASLPIALAWWLLAQADAWVSSHAGEINAWLIARFGWSDISRLFQAHAWISRWIRWVMVPVASLSLLATLLGHDRRAAAQERWLRRAWHWRTLGLASLVFVVLMVLPWKLAAWQPALPATWVQPAVAALRLGVVTMLWSIGAAVLVALSVQRKRV